MSLCIGETSRSLKQSIEETHAERVLSTKVQGESSMLEISLKYWWCLWKLVWCQHILYGKPGAFCVSTVCTDCNLALFLRLFVSLYLNWHEVESELKKSHLNWIKCPCFSEIFSLAHESFFLLSIQTELCGWRNWPSDWECGWMFVLGGVNQLSFWGGIRQSRASLHLRHCSSLAHTHTHSWILSHCSPCNYS